MISNEAEDAGMREYNRTHPPYIPVHIRQAVDVLGVIVAVSVVLIGFVVWLCIGMPL